jgi:PAS domain S-box-containing protein
MKKTFRILYVDDSQHDREMVRDALENEAGGFSVTEAISYADFEIKLNEDEYDLVLSDFNILGFEGLQVLDAVHAQDPSLPVVIVTGTGSEEIAVEALKRGAADYVIKSTRHIRRLAQTIQHVLANATLERERQQANEALRESENRFRNAFDQAAVGMCMITPQGVFKKVNRSLCQMLGYSQQELLEKSVYQITHPDDLSASSEQINRSINNEQQTIQFEKRYLHKDGHVLWVSISSSLVCNELNEPLYFISQIQDISESKRIKSELEEERNLFQILMDNVPDGIYFKDSESRFIRINRAQASHLKLSDALQALGKMDFDYFSEQHARPAYEDEQNIIQSGQPLIDQEEKETWPDGHTGWVSTTKMPIQNGTGQIVGTFGISRDITRRKHTEETLRESEELFKSFFENAGDAILLTAPDGKIFATNPSAQSIFGWTEQEMIEGGRRLLVDTTDPRLADALKERAEKGKVQVELTFLRKDGSKFEGELTSAVYRDKNDNQKTVMIIRDITERKQAEVSLQQRLLELETVNQLSMRLRGGDTVQELLQILLDETLKTIHAEDGAIFLFEHTSYKLKLTISSGWCDQLAGLTLETDEGINGDVFSTNQPYITSEMQSDQLLSRKVKSLIPPQQSGGFFPIQCSEGIIGVLDVFVPLPRTISENEKRLLIIISQLAGNATLRSRLTEKLKLSNIDLQREIEQRAAMQKMLAAEKELLSTTLMSIAEGVIITDKEGYIILYNRAAETITGYEAAKVFELPLDSVFRIIDPNTQQFISDLIQTLYAMNRAQDNDPNYKSPLLITKSGEKILVAGSISLLKTPNEETMGHVLVFQNITEKQKTEAQTALSEKMEAIGQLAAGIAHEINTPIQYIGDNLRFLQKTFSKFTEILEAYQKVTAEAERYLTQEDIDAIEALKKQNRIQHYLKESPGAVQEALDGVERVRKIVLAMREFSHPSEKEKKLADINHGIETTIVISRNEWKYYAELETDLDPDLPLVNCQIDEINQVILNMIVNAAQAIHEKLGEGSEGKGKISISTRQDENKIRIIIQDTGKGIPEAIQMRIFDPFFTTKGVGKGTGQGLSMAHNIIVKKHKGSIKVESIVGEGATFTIEIPLDSSEQEA